LGFNFPQAPHAAVLDDSEVVLAVRIVFFGERREGPNFGEKGQPLVCGKGRDAGGDDDRAFGWGSNGRRPVTGSNSARVCPELGLPPRGGNSAPQLLYQ